MKIRFSVPGEPQGKGRPRFGTPRGKPVVWTPAETVNYEHTIVAEYKLQVGNRKFPDKAMIDMRIIAYFTIPASASKKRKKLMENGEIRPTKRPDMDNIIKIIADSLNQIAYRDDAQVVDCQIRKYYSKQPRIEITLISVD